eukprot:3357966-Rhodomonas_salina.1
MVLPGARAGGREGGWGEGRMACYAMSGKEIANGAIVLRACYAMSGTEIAYDATTRRGEARVDVGRGGRRCVLCCWRRRIAVPLGSISVSATRILVATPVLKQAYGAARAEEYGGRGGHGGGVGARSAPYLHTRIFLSPYTYPLISLRVSTYRSMLSRSVPDLPTRILLSPTRIYLSPYATSPLPPYAFLSFRLCSPSPISRRIPSHLPT